MLDTLEKSILDHGLIILAITATAVLWIVFLVLMLRSRARLRNCFIFLLAVVASVLLVGLLTYDKHPGILVGEFVAIGFALLIVPFFLMINGVKVMKKEGRSKKHALALLLGIVILAGEIMIAAAVLSGADTGNAWFIVLLFGGLSIFYGSTMFLSFVLYSAAMQIVPHTRHFDYVVILGCALKKDGTPGKLLQNRLDKAIQVYEKDKTPPYLIPSGGRGKDEACSEADSMYYYLLKEGIPAEMIIEEDQSANTYENLRNAKAIVDARQGRKKFAFVTSNYHVYRAWYYCRKQGIDCIGIGAPVAFYYWPSAMIREFAAIILEKRHLKLFLLGWLVFLAPFAFLILRSVLW